MSDGDMKNQLIMKLEKTNVVYAKKLSNEIERNRKVQAQVESLQAKVKREKGRSIKHHRDKEGPSSFMSRLGTHQISEVMARRKQREIKMLEAELNRVTKMADRENEVCLDKKREIDELRKDAINQNERFAVTQKDIERSKLQMTKLLAAAQKIDLENQEILDKHKAMTKKSDKAKAEFYATHHETLNFKAKAQSKKREKIEQMDVGGPGMTPGQRVRKRMKELAAEAKAIRAEDSSKAREIEKYETASEALRRCTGLTDLDDIVRVFTEEEDRKLRQLHVVQDLIAQYKADEAERRYILEETKEYESNWSSFDQQQQAKIDAFGDKVHKIKAETEEYNKRNSTLTVEVERLGECVHRLFYSLDCEETGIDTTMQMLIADRERRGSFFGPQRRNSAQHREILKSMQEDGDLLKTSELKKAARGANPQGDDESVDTEAREKQLMAEGLMEKPPEVVPLHRKAFPRMDTPGYDPDDETYRARSMGTPTRSGTRRHAREEIGNLIKTGVTVDNLGRYLSIVEHRVLKLATDLKIKVEEKGSGVEPSLDMTGTNMFVSAPPMQDFEAPTTEVDNAQIVSALDKTLTKMATSPTRANSPAWRWATPAVSPIAGARRPKKTNDPLPKVVSRTQLEDEVLRDYSDTDLSQFIKKLTLKEPPPPGGTRRGGTGRRPKSRTNPGSLAVAGSQSLTMSM